MSFAVASTASLRAPVAFRGKAAARRPARVAVRPPTPVIDRAIPVIAQSTLPS